MLVTRSKLCVLRFSKISACVNSFSTAFSREDVRQDRNEKARQSGGLGDQKAYYIQNLRKVKRVSGDVQFYANRQSNRFDDRNRGNVSGFGGRGSRSNFTAGASLQPVHWDKVQLPDLQKDLYEAHSLVSERSLDEIKKWLSDNECKIQGNDVPRPIFGFDESCFPDPIVNHLSSNFQQPMAIQGVSWPIALSGRDMISISKTGSGKTLGFILPAIVHAKNQVPRRRGEGPSVLVILPTRELALQVYEVTREYCKMVGLESACCYGGASKETQANLLLPGVDICIATPGRALDFLEAKVLKLNRCSFLVLDEADRMLDMGFEPQIRSIVSQLRPDRQTLMFSATWPKEVQELAHDFHNDPVHVTVGSLDLAANHNIEQIVEVIDDSEKENRLEELLSSITKKSDCRTLIFVETKRRVDHLTSNLRRSGWKAMSIHGDKSQSQREWVLSEFKAGRTPLLLATDVAARGLDVDDIKYVINFDYPNNSKDYIHRIGRTGRRNKTGISYTFFNYDDADKAQDLIDVLEEAKQTVPETLRALTLKKDESARSNYKQHRGFFRKRW